MTEYYPDGFPAGHVPNMQVEYHLLPSAAPRGAWRAPGHVVNAFAIECFLDEIAVATNRDPVELRLAASDEGPARSLILGADVGAGQQLQGLVAPGEWQAARPFGAAVHGYSLVSCVVVPGFDFAGFKLAPPGWEPGA